MYTPFVYEIEEISSGKKYIGSKSSKNCTVDMLGTIYFTSSKNSF